MVVNPATNFIGFTRAMGMSVNAQGGPLVTIDEVPTAGEAGQTLAQINPASIESISITKRINVLYGSQGANGVISIYLKKGLLATQITPNFQSLKVAGYSTFRPYRSPDYDDHNIDVTVADYRSTIFWAPEVITNTLTGRSEVSFFAADLSGQYRVVVEGLNSDGNPVRAVSFIKIDDL